VDEKFGVRTAFVAEINSEKVFMRIMAPPVASTASSFLFI
jgi:hypothetical protein